MPRGVTFDETMTGPFALGETDPEAGRDKGKREGTNFTMRATIAVPDLAAFIDDPDHLADLSGKIDFPPIGIDLVATSGVFNLFSPSGDPSMNHMIYGLATKAEGKPYYMAGIKLVKDDRGFDLWSDTTTLYTTLHEGSSKDGKIAGAGVLTIGVGGVKDLLSALRVTGTNQPIEKAATVAKFGQFFMGELWDTYGLEVLGNNSGEGRG